MAERRFIILVALAVAAISLLFITTSKTFMTTRTPMYRLWKHARPAALVNNSGINGCDGNAFCIAVLNQQQERQQGLRAVCQSNLSCAPPGGPLSIDSVATLPGGDRYIKVPKLGVSYCDIPKCASTTIKSFFARVSGIQCHSKSAVHVCVNRQLGGGDSQGGARLPQRGCSRSQLQQQQQLLQLQANVSYLLLVVRNPWMRLVSAYVDKVVTERRLNFARACYRRHGLSHLGKVPLNFSQFVQCLVADYEAGKPLDVHIAPMHSICNACAVKYDYIATVETLGDDFRFLLRYVFPEITGGSAAYDESFAAGDRRPNELRNETVKHYAGAYASLSTNELESIIRLYRPDALYYGYPERPA